MYFEIIGQITGIETIAVGSSIRELPRFLRRYGRGRWRKLKGIATVRLTSGRMRRAEVHWYEARENGNAREEAVRDLHQERRL